MREKVPERYFYDPFGGERCSEGQEREIELFWGTLSEEQREH